MNIKSVFFLPLTSKLCGYFGPSLFMARREKSGLNLNALIMDFVALFIFPFFFVYAESFGHSRSVGQTGKIDRTSRQTDRQTHTKRQIRIAVTAARSNVELDFFLSPGIASFSSIQSSSQLHLREEREKK